MYQACITEIYHFQWIVKLNPVAYVIEGFREKTLLITPGGGGKYGEISFNEDLVEKEEKESVTTLDSFF